MPGQGTYMDYWFAYQFYRLGPVGVENGRATRSFE